MKILRCYNCQQYSDHVAANCPRKDTPVCFRCGQNHPFNPNCQNNVCCAHCKGDHLSGSSNCPVNIEERRKCILAAQTFNRVQRQQPIAPSSTWNNDTSYPAAPTSLFSIVQRHKPTSTANVELSKKSIHSWQRSMYSPPNNREAPTTWRFYFKTTMHPVMN